MAVRAGFAPAALRSTSGRSGWTELTDLKWAQGWESHPPSPAYETGQSTGSPCIWKMARRHGNAPCRLNERWFYRPVRLFSGLPPRSVFESSRGRLHHSMKMARRVGTAPTFPGFGVLRIACLPPPFLCLVVSSHERARRLVIHTRRLLPNPSEPFHLHRHSAPFHGRPPPRGERPTTKERTPLPRAG